MTSSFTTTQHILKIAEQSMHNATEALKKRFNTLRTGRASPGMLESLRIEQSDGATVLLGHISRIVTRSAQELLVTPHQIWDKSLLATIQKAITKTELGLTPSIQSNEIRVFVSPLSQDRRKDFVKLIRQEAESICNEIRNYRREANGRSKVLLKQKSISEDEDYRTHATIQKLTDNTIAKINALTQEKEKELMQV